MGQPLVLTRGLLTQKGPYEDPSDAAEAQGLLTRLPAEANTEVDRSLEGALTRNRLRWNSQTGQLEQTPEPLPSAPPEATSTPEENDRYQPTGVESILQQRDDDLERMDLANKVGLGITQAEDVRHQRAYYDEKYGPQDPASMREYEGHKGLNAETAAQKAHSQEPVSDYSTPDAASVAPLVPKYQSGLDNFKWYTPIKDTINFVLSDDMGLLGMKWDDEGFSMGWGNMKRQWAEHPVASVATLASYAFPIGAAWMKGARVAKRAAEIGEMGGKLASGAEYKFGLHGAYKAGQVKEGFFANAREYAGMRFGSNRLDDHSNLVKNLAYGKYNEGRNLFSESTITRLRAAQTPEDVAKIVSPEDLRKILISDYHENAALQLRKRAIRGELTSTKDKARWWFQERFANDYWMGNTTLTAAKLKNVHKFFDDAKFNEWLEKVPSLSEDAQKATVKYWHGKFDGQDLHKMVGDDAMAWINEYRDRGKQLFEAQFDEGMIGEDTYRLFMDPDKVGTEFHLPALRRGTPDADTLNWVANKAAGLRGRGANVRILQEEGVDLARFFTAPTMKQRQKYLTADDVIMDLDNLITDPESILRGGLIRDELLFNVHRGFRDVISEAMKGNPAFKMRVASAEELAAMPMKARNKHWVEFDKLNEVAPGLADRLRNMVKVAAKKEGRAITDADIPMAIDKATVEGFFGKSPGSAAGSVSMFSKFFELLTTVHKTSRTALNPATHMNNIIGNFAFLAMAGYNPFSNQAFDDGKLVTRLFIRAAKAYRAEREAAVKAGRTVEGIVFDSKTIADHLGDARFMADNHGGQIDLAEFFSHDAIRNLLEEQGFQSVEGLQHAEKLLRQIERAENKGWARGSAPVKTLASLIAGVGEAPGIKKTLQDSSAAYLGEDMIPKMMYSMHLARKGWGMDAIIREVGRRLPQYQSVGDLNKAARKVVMPWITFPAETARILKNNMMDKPLAMMTWMRAPDIARGVTAAAGLGPHFEEWEDAIKQMAPWNQRWTTILMNSENANTLMGAAAGATAGGMAGGLATGSLPGALGGAAVGGLAGAMAPAPTMGAIGGAAVGAVAGGLPGAAVGGAAGLGAGAMLDAYESDKSKQDKRVAAENGWVRGYIMDFVPLAAMTPTSISDYELAKLNPASDEAVTGKTWFHGAIDMLPVEPFAVAMPLFNLYAGVGSFGQPIDSRSRTDYAGKLALGLMGFLAPPFMQKYGLKMTGPEGNPIDMAASFAKNGERMSVPNEVNPTWFGMSSKGLTALAGAALGAGVAAVGGSRLRAVQGTAKAAATAAGAFSPLASPASKLGVAGISAAAGALSGLAGYSINSRRLFSDLGLIEDPYTGRVGNHTLDFFANNFFGTAKSFSGSPMSAIMEDNKRDREFTDIRKIDNKNLYDALLNRRDTGKAMEIISGIKKGFIAQYGQTQTSDMKFEEWFQNFINGMPADAVLGGVSKEELLIRLEAYRAAREEKNKFQDQKAREIHKALDMQRAMRFRGLTIVDEDLPQP